MFLPDAIFHQNFHAHNFQILDHYNHYTNIIFPVLDPLGYLSYQNLRDHNYQKLIFHLHHCNHCTNNIGLVSKLYFVKHTDCQNINDHNLRKLIFHMDVIRPHTLHTIYIILFLMECVLLNKIYFQNIRHHHLPLNNLHSNHNNTFFQELDSSNYLSYQNLRDRNPY